MPRPMTPVPITARLRSGRETSRGMMLGGKGPILRVSIASRRRVDVRARFRQACAIRLLEEEPHAFTRTHRCARAVPGAAGYALSQMHMGAFRIPHMQKLPWDPVRDFTYIIGLSGYTFGVVVKSDSPFKSFRDLLDYARANPGKMSYGSTGTGTSPHLLMEEVALKTGVEFLHVPFKGNADSTQALLGDHIMAQSDSSGWGRFVDAGQFRLLVTFGSQRTKHWSGVPTANDLGLDMVYSSPYGIVGPRGLEPRVVKILHDGFKKALDDPEHQKVLDQLDQELWYRSSEDYAKYARETLQRERALIERLGLLAK